MIGSLGSYEIKKGKRWYYTVRINDEVTGKAKTKKKGGFKTERQARAALLEINVELNNGTYIKDEDRVTFKDFFENWLELVYRPRLLESTFKKYKYSIDKHILDNNCFLNKRMVDITVDDIRRFYRDKAELGLSSSYINDIAQWLKSSFDEAVYENLIRRDPTERAAIPTLEYKDKTIWTKEELNKFLSLASDEHMYIVFLLALTTGMRQGEIRGLRWRDLDFEKSLIYVRKSLTRDNDLKSPKTKAAIRNISIPTNVMNALQLHKEKQDELIDIIKDSYEDNDYVNATGFGTPYNPSNILRTMNRLIKESGVRKITFHEMRHTYASHLLSNNVDVVRVSSRLGHADPKITYSTYSHVVSVDDDIITDVISDIIEI